MNDLSPPDAPAASVANAPPPIAEAVNPADAETAAGFSPAGEADAPVEPPAPEPSLELAPAAPPEAAPRLRPTRFGAKSLRAADRLGDRSMRA